MNQLLTYQDERRLQDLDNAAKQIVESWGVPRDLHALRVELRREIDRLLTLHHQRQAERAS
jgi:hypothetical protein